MNEDLIKKTAQAIRQAKVEETQLTGSISNWILKGSASRVLQNLLDQVLAHKK